MPLALAATLERPIDPVTITGDALPAFTGAALDRIHVYRWDSVDGNFVAIPFQFAERHQWNLALNLLQPQRCPALGPDFPDNANICALEPSFTSAGDPGGDPEIGLDADDELTFMARDAGPQAPVRPAPPSPGTVAILYYELRIEDKRLAGTSLSTDGEGFVYVFLWDSAHARETEQHYVSWTAKGLSADSDRSSQECETLDIVPDRGYRSCGWAVANADATTGQATHATIDVRWLGNWTVNRVKYRAKGTTSSGADILDRFKIRVGNSPENKQNERDWNRVGCPRFLGLQAYTASDHSAPIRVSRFVQGARSGGATTRNDWYYGTHLHTRIRLRVHENVPDLRMFPDLVSTWSDAKVFNRDHLPSNPSSPADTVDGLGPSGPSVGSLESEEKAFNWNLFERAGERLLVVTRETRPLRFNEEDREYYYDDTGLTESEDPEFEPGRFGNAGKKWPGQTLNMDDLTCNDPPNNNENSNWREAEVYILAVDPDHEHTDYLTWLENPVLATSRELSLITIPAPPPPPPCPPILAPVYANQGTAVHLGITTGCTPQTRGFGVYRALGMGAYQHVAWVPTGQAFVDRSVRRDNTYKYRVFAYNEFGGVSASSSIVSITPVDDMIPPPPANVEVEPLSGGARLTWTDADVWDLTGNRVLAAGIPGGPYVKLVSQDIGTDVQSYVVQGLDPSEQYCVVMQSVDLAGNVSEPSSEVCFSPLS